MGLIGGGLISPAVVVVGGCCGCGGGEWRNGGTGAVTATGVVTVIVVDGVGNGASAAAW